jgi:hypothetical protein
VKAGATRFFLLDLGLLTGVLLGALHLHRHLRLDVHQDLALDGCGVAGGLDSLSTGSKLKKYS